APAAIACVPAAAGSAPASRSRTRATFSLPRPTSSPMLNVLVNSASSCATSRTTAPPPGAPPRLMHSNATYRGRANILKHPNRLNVRSGSVAGPPPAPRSEGEHSADQGLPGDEADDAVDGDRQDVQVQGLLEAADGGVGLGPEDPVDPQARARVAGQVAELELLLDPADGVALAALPDRDDQGRPGDGAGDAVDGQALLLLEAADGGVGAGPEDAVRGEVAAAGPEQVLQGLDGMLLVTLADERP